MQQKQRMLDFVMQDLEDKFAEIVQDVSKENLELGCKMIRKAVISKARKWVKQDPQILEAIDKRQKWKQSGEKYFVDNDFSSQIAELPPQLRPNKTGLSDDQF